MLTVTQTAAVIAGLAIMASPFMLTRNGLLRSLASAVGLAIVAAVIIRVLASETEAGLISTNPESDAQPQSQAQAAE